VGQPVTVGLVQINNSFSGQNYLPYSVACLESYVRGRAADPARYRFLEPVYRRAPIHGIVEHLAAADVAGFSTYVWNERISLEAARRLKERRPEATVVFGGPQVPNDPEGFLHAHRFIDAVVLGEGEATFLELLEGWPEVRRDDVQGIAFLTPTGRFVKTLPRPRLRDLEELPSPFLTGVLDPLMRAHPEETWIGLWETNRGCPFRCTFCDWGSATAAKVSRLPIERLKREADWFVDHAIEFLFVCDANFGSQKHDPEIAAYLAQRRRETGYPQGVSVQNTKNATERAYETQKILSDAGLNKGVTLSMQSLDRRTLKNVERDNISLETYFTLAQRFMRDRVETYSDLILALPGETYDSFCDGVDTLITAGQHSRIQFNNLSVLPNAALGSAESMRRFGMAVVEVEIINIHGTRERFEDDVPEYQKLVVATDTMPAADWRRARVFAWMTSFLHFDKLLQIPLVCAHELAGLGYRAMVEAFLAADPQAYPIIAGVVALFRREAVSIQNGGAEYVYSAEWLGIHWPADEYAFITLTAEGRIDAFYAEAEALLLGLVGAGRPEAAAAVADAVRLNRALLKQPFVAGDVEVVLAHDVHALWQGVRCGERQELARGEIRIRIDRTSRTWSDFQAWCREVVWWGNKKGAYLYGSQPVRQLAGHF
jgi:hypothetical protein